MWTGSEMIVWGGTNATGYLADGKRWKPGSGGGTWTTIVTSPLAARSNASGVWTGTKMIVFGGCYGTSCGSFHGDSAAYDPVTDSWTTLASPPSDLDARAGHAGVASSGLATFFEGYGAVSSGSPYRDGGASYDPISASWKTIASPGETLLKDAKRASAFVWWGSGKLWTWGGYGSAKYLSNGASYDPSTGSWSAMPAAPTDLTGRSAGSIVWTGSEAILWGGNDPSFSNTGAIYRP